jgi:hypothetical protein
VFCVLCFVFCAYMLIRTPPSNSNMTMKPHGVNGHGRAVSDVGHMTQGHLHMGRIMEVDHMEWIVRGSFSIEKYLRVSSRHLRS